jgi:hypothetical protein
MNKDQNRFLGVQDNERGARRQPPGGAANARGQPPGGATHARRQPPGEDAHARGQPPGGAAHARRQPPGEATNACGQPHCLISPPLFLPDKYVLDSNQPIQTKLV